ncbi:MAG: rRNA pseudouridine synthase [Planctomycetes bacterium]|nr:rRNA pseudouridine synthase [Planctomycetota bacterium]
MRLNHFLAMAGVCSRRAADGLIAGGRVEVNGELVRELGVRVDPQHDDVRCDGSRVQPEKPVYVLLNKPAGVVCTNARHEQKQRVIDLLPTVRGRLFTVGRLDADSEGLLLVTNDGNFALEMTHPRYGVPKLYAVLVRGHLTQEHLQKARGGVWLAEGPTAGMDVHVERSGRDRTYLKVTLREGKNREIRRVFAKLGYPVETLKRIRIGDLNLHRLSVGEWRFLQAHEVTRLREVARGADAPLRDDGPSNQDLGEN